MAYGGDIGSYLFDGADVRALLPSWEDVKGSYVQRMRELFAEYPPARENPVKWASIILGGTKWRGYTPDLAKAATA